MVILHGIWARENFHLWGEDTTRYAAPTATRVLTAHPAALPAAELHAAVGELSPDGLLASIAGDAELCLWMPALGGEPMPSTDERVGVVDEAGGAVALSRFVVPTLSVKPADAIDLLVSLPRPWPQACSGSIRFWARLAQYALDLLARGQFVPEVETGEGARALWRVVLRAEEELEWLHELTRTMPPACRALANGDGRDADAATLVESFLQTCADAVVRRTLDEDEFFHQIHERATAESPWEVRWLSALIGDHRELAGAEDQRAGFVNQVRSWLARVDEAGTELPTKLCFVLNEPDLDFDDEEDAGDVAAMPPENPVWRLDFRLQALDGGTELHDIAEVWEEDGSAPAILRRRFANRREHLMADLARAAEVFPYIEESLKTEAPTGMDLNSVQASLFMRDGAPLLEARGFGVRLPDWAHQRAQQLGLRLKLHPESGSRDPFRAPAAGLGLGSMIAFEWQIAVGDTNLTLEQFDQLRAENAPLVRLRDQWVFLEAEAADMAARFLAEKQSGEMTLGQAIRTAAGAADVEAGLPVIGVQATDWIERLLREAAEAKIEPVEQPVAFCGDLRPYQLRGLEWLIFMDRIGIGACLADDMGLGKTIQLIALLLEERTRREKIGPTLIFTPMSVVGNWQREIERFGPELSVFVHHGPDRLTGDAFVRAAKETDAVVTTYALGHRDLETLQRVPWHRIVLDEAQKIKNPSAAQTIAIRSLPSTYRVALTGTPLENHLSELWSIMEMLNPGLLGTAADFRRRFAVPVERLRDERRAEQLRRLIHPFVLRRIKSDPEVQCDLPEKMEMKVFCNLTAEQASLYEQVVSNALGEVEQATGIRRRGVILAALTKLKQICNHPAHFLGDGSAMEGRSGKFERLKEMLEEVLAEGDGALIFTQFRVMGDLLARALTESLHSEILFLHGGTPARHRQAMVDRFQDPKGGVKIFLLSLRAGGLGLNLTAANHVFHFDRWWNPAVEAQATDRVYRIGQTQRVQVHKFVCIGTIEDRIDRMLSDKTALAERIVGSGDDWLTSLTTEELRQYLTLSREAIGDL